MDKSPRVYRPIAVVESPTYRALTLNALRVLDRIDIESAQRGGNEHGAPVSYASFQEFGVNRSKIGSAIREVVAAGFVEVLERGITAPTVYRLTWEQPKRRTARG